MAAGSRLSTAWQILLVLCVSIGYESLFLHYGLNVIDETWPLYAAMRLEAGGVLYDDTFWVFPPGHLFSAWIAYTLDPPGIVLARYFYAGFDVALCVAIYLLGRRLMPGSFALLGGLLVAVAAPRSHLFQLLFGYRYLVLSAMALLAFARRLETGQRRWMWAAGAWAGLALTFRLTPAFAVSCAIGIGVIAADREWRSWLRDWSCFAGGLLAVTGPVIIWFASSVGPVRLWTEIVVRPVTMMAMQTLPMPDIVWPDLGDRVSIYQWFVAVQFRAILFFYGGLVVALGWAWLHALRARKPFEHALLLTTVTWGAIYFIRSLRRSDESHIDSAIPAVCLLVAYLVNLGFRTVWSDGQQRRLLRSAAQYAVAIGVFSTWVYLLGSDLYIDERARGRHVIPSIDPSVKYRSASRARHIGRVVGLVRRKTLPEDQILNLGPTPAFHLLTERTGPGYSDLIMPGTFFSEPEQISFLQRLREAPPAAIIWTEEDFDGYPDRSIEHSAPRIADWVRANYRPSAGRQRRWVVWLRRREPPGTS